MQVTLKEKKIKKEKKGKRDQNPLSGFTIWRVSDEIK